MNYVRFLIGLLVFVLQGWTVQAQGDISEEQILVVDSLYREDQVYIGLGLDLLTNKPEGISQNGFSGHFSVGFIRDMPFNKRRNKSIGVGLGLGVDVYNQNLFIGEESDDTTSIYAIVPDNIGQVKNRFSYYSVQMPIQYRWRTSSATDYTFWRIYTGIQLEYIYHFKSTFEQSGNTVNQTKIPELNKIQYGLTFAFGYSAFNLKVYYGLNSLFNEDAILTNGNKVDLQVLRLGLQFYFL
ncbi:PorT family protein [Dokdonia sinensis]|uniref:PorT family protein n=2 Tax=Dokdonia sinensis TaxID=2479847 RepID=A0A3M0G3P6_9FLAO|nr:PorT family protein [Dokdonia sinensis]